VALAISLALSPRRLIPAVAVGLLISTVVQGETPASRTSAEAPFLAENDAAMAAMMQGMTIKPSGDVDADFAAMMIPHHQGAIDMAEAELRHGRNEALRRIAQEIVVEQQQEIAAMRLALGQPLPPSAPSPTEAAPVSPDASPSMQRGLMRPSPSMSMKGSPSP
jgi:Domain of unknown function (DUF305)